MEWQETEYYRFNGRDREFNVMRLDDNLLPRRVWTFWSQSVSTGNVCSLALPSKATRDPSTDTVTHLQNTIPTDCEELLSRQVALAAQNQELASALEEALKLIEQLSAESPNVDSSAAPADQLPGDPQEQGQESAPLQMSAQHQQVLLRQRLDEQVALNRAQASEYGAQIQQLADRVRDL